MRKIQRGTLYAATVADDWAAVAGEYGLGVELDQYCSAENMDSPGFEAVDRAVRRALSELAAGRRAAFKGASGLPLILHAPFNELFPAAIDPRALRLAHERYGQAFDLAASYGASKMVVHSGYVPLVYFKEWHLQRSLEFWAEFLEGREAGPALLIENVLEDEPYMLRDLAEGLKEQLADRGWAVRLCLDVGHAHCMSKAAVLEWIAVLGPYLGHVHLHNNDGGWDDHKMIGDGSMDMEAVLSALLQYGPADLTFTLESRDCRGSLEWLLRRGFMEEENGKA